MAVPSEFSASSASNFCPQGVPDLSTVTGLLSPCFSLWTRPVLALLSVRLPYIRDKAHIKGLNKYSGLGVLSTRNVRGSP